VAAVLLAIELLLFELRPRSLLPVALACAVAGSCGLVFEAGPLFPLEPRRPAHWRSVRACWRGCCAARWRGLTLALYRTEDAFDHLRLHWMWWPAIGGLVVGIGGFSSRAHSAWATT
jgi:H+/Cl- antiporter ClcA